MAKKDEEVGSLGLEYKQVDVVDQIMGIVNDITAWAIEMIAVAINVAIAILNWLLALAGL